jgi:hypothetical protein
MYSSSQHRGTKRERQLDVESSSSDEKPKKSIKKSGKGTGHRPMSLRNQYKKGLLLKKKPLIKKEKSEGDASEERESKRIKTITGHLESLDVKEEEEEKPAEATTMSDSVMNDDSPEVRPYYDCRENSCCPKCKAKAKDGSHICTVHGQLHSCMVTGCKRAFTTPGILSIHLKLKHNLALVDSHSK